MISNIFICYKVGHDKTTFVYDNFCPLIYCVKIILKTYHLFSNGVRLYHGQIHSLLTASNRLMLVNSVYRLVAEKTKRSSVYR